MSNVWKNIQEVETINDDFLIYSRTITKQDESLKTVLKTLKKKNRFKLNKEKCESTQLLNKMFLDIYDTIALPGPEQSPV